MKKKNENTSADRLSTKIVRSSTTSLIKLITWVKFSGSLKKSSN